MNDAGRQDASADGQELERLTVLAFGAVILLGGLNGIAAKQILRIRVSVDGQQCAA
jgi:hypothetical protein